jgi:hypothetical protein
MLSKNGELENMDYNHIANNLVNEINKFLIILDDLDHKIQNIHNDIPNIAKQLDFGIPKHQLIKQLQVRIYEINICI